MKSKEKLSHHSLSLSLYFCRSFGAGPHGSPAWSRSVSKKESDSSSLEDTGQAYVVGKDANA